MYTSRRTKDEESFQHLFGIFLCLQKKTDFAPVVNAALMNLVGRLQAVN